MQVVTNLLTNASKFSPRGETVQVDVRANAETRTARLSVEDRGPGIVDDVRDKVFKKFTQIDSSDQRSHGGVGLGLAISKEIVELHGGTINFSSQVGRGTTFYFDLPLVE
ncbi:ATP-binding protein [Thioclava sp. 15-R06ZXC-3]|uniref:histidine kinase n=2 Tax=Thioclava TaxID=285107 RepID=A0ABV3TJL8_9RHOB